MKNADRVVLIITGAIDVRSQSVPFTQLTDTNQRLIQYINSISYAIKNYKTVKQFVFCENTDYKYDYSQLKNEAKLNNKELEILSFHGNYTKIKELGKGYGEGEIIEYAINTSKFINESSIIIKLTGRLLISNFDDVLNSTTHDLAFDFYPQFINQNSKNYVSTIFFKCSILFYKSVLLDAYKEVNDIELNYIEYIFYRRLKLYKIKSFNKSPYIIGESGSIEKAYKINIKSKIIKSFLRNFGFRNLHKNIFEKCFCSLTLFVISNTTKLINKKAKNNIFNA